MPIQGEFLLVKCSKWEISRAHAHKGLQVLSVKDLKTLLGRYKPTGHPMISRLKQRPRKQILKVATGDV